MTRLLGAGLAVLAASCLSFLAWREYRRTQEIISPWIILLVLTVFDILVPAAVFLVAGPPDLVYWMGALDIAGVIPSMLIALVSLLFFAAGYFFVSGRTERPGRDGAWRNVARLRINVRLLYLGLFVTGGLYMLHLVLVVRTVGSLDVYLSDKFRERFLRPDELLTGGFLDRLLFHLGPAMLTAFLVLVGIAFFLRHEYGHPILWGLVLPGVAWFLVSTTFYRGGQLHFFLGLAFLEMCRLRLSPERQRHPRKPVLTTRTKALVASAVVLFVIYGAYRAYNTGFQWGNPVSVSEAVTAQVGEFTRGHGLISLTLIRDYYPRAAEYLEGRTLRESLLLPVPRAVWPDKPEWYGTEGVTRDMGWSTTTQTPVTMPGELHANFGPKGLVLVALFGIFFGTFHRHRLHPTFFFVYAMTVPRGVLLAHWFSSTGVMTWLTSLPVALVVAYLVLGRRSADRQDLVDGGVAAGPRALVVASQRR